MRSRVEQLGVDTKTTAAAHHDTLLDAVNDMRVRAAADDLRLRAELPGVVSKAPLKSAVRAAGSPPASPTGTRCSRRPTRRATPRARRTITASTTRTGRRTPGTTSSAARPSREADDEYADLSCFLEVCREVGIEPLVVILPVHGAWYDREGVPAERAAGVLRARPRHRDTAGAAYADFSTCEYEKYFLCDTVHPGWRGWVRIEQAFYDFVHDRDDAFLGGGSFGAAEGLDAAGNAGASLAGAGEAAS